MALEYDGKEYFEAKHSFYRENKNVYFGMRAYRNGECLDTTGDDANYRIVFKYGVFGKKLCVYDLTIDPKTNYFRGWDEKNWLLERCDDYTFRFNPEMEGSGVIYLVDAKTGEELADMTIAVHIEDRYRYISGAEVGYEVGEAMYSREVLLPKSVYAFWNDKETTIAQKRLWFDLSITGTRLRIESVLSAKELEAFIEEYKDDALMRFSVATQKVTKGILDVSDNVESIAIKGALTGLQEGGDGVWYGLKAILQKGSGMEVTAFDELLESWNARNDELGDYITQDTNVFAKLLNPDAAQAKEIIAYLAQNTPDSLKEKTIASDIDGWKPNWKFTRNTYKAIKKVVKEMMEEDAYAIDGLDIHIDEAKWIEDNVSGIMSKLGQKQIEINGEVCLLSKYVDLDKSYDAIKNKITAWFGDGMDWKEGDSNGDIEVEAEELTYTEYGYWQNLDSKYSNSGIYKKFKRLAQSKAVKTGKALLPWVSVVFNCAKVEKTVDEYERVLDVWEKDLTALRDSFRKGSEEYLIYDTVLKELRNEIENEVANVLFGIVEPLTKTGLKKGIGIDSLLKECGVDVGKALSMQTQLAKMGLSIVTDDTESSKGKVWTLEDLYKKYETAQSELKEALEEYRIDPSSEQYYKVVALADHYIIMSASATNTMCSIIKADAERWSDTAVLAVIDVCNLPGNVIEAFAQWVTSGDVQAFEVLVRQEEKKNMKLSVARIQENTNQQLNLFYEYLFPFEYTGNVDVRKDDESGKDK